MRGTNIGEFEELILLAVASLMPNAYGFAIMAELEKSTGRKLNLSSLHASLYRLQRKGLVNSEFGEPTNKRGGKKKKYYQLSTQGVVAITTAKDIRSGFWDNISLASLKEID